MKDLDWIEHSKHRPTEENWYLVAVAGSKDYMPMVTIAWWNCGQGWGWRDFANYTTREDRLHVLFWAEMPALPPSLKRIRDRLSRAA